MSGFVQHEILRQGRVVARFQTTPEETQRAAALVLPKLTVGLRFNKNVLLAAGFIAGAGIALGHGYWPDEWSIPFADLLAGLAAGVMLALLLLAWAGQRQKQAMRAFAGSSEADDVTVTCHEKGVSWSSAGMVHYVDFAALDQVSEREGAVLLRRRLFVFHIPAHGFLNAGERDFLMAELRRNLVAEKFEALTVEQG